MTVLAYHFTGDRLRDGRPLPAIGEWLVHDGPVQMCASGLHYSPTPWDALQYAPGPILHRVEVEDIVETEHDKGVCRRRRILQSGDATEMLRYFSRMQALSVVHLWDAPEVVLDWLMTGDESLHEEALAAAMAARDAAWAAAQAAAGAAERAAAWAAAQAAAGAAERAAAWAAEGAAAWEAARAAGNAVGAAAWAAAGAAERAAARDAARYAAWAAAGKAERDEFNVLVMECFDHD